MEPKKGVVGLACAAVVATSMGALAGVCYADADYAPTVLGNSAYSNQVDKINDYTVHGIDYTSSIANQNADTVAQARALAVTMGTDAQTASPIVVTNSLGQDIVGLSYKAQADEKFPASLLSGTLSKGESACWFYEYDYTEQKMTNQAGVVVSMPQTYSLQATLADGTTAEFHDINMNGVRTLNLCYSDTYGVNYVERTTVTNHTPDPNLYYEVNRAAYDGDAQEFNYHVNSAGRMGDLMYTEARGDGWQVGHEPLQDIEDFGIEPPLVGYYESDFNDGVLGPLAWNGDRLTWRLFNNE